MNNLKHVLTTKDFLATGNTFEILKNPETGILETHPKPTLAELPKYYDSQEYISHNQKSLGIISFCYKQVRSISTKRKIKICTKHIKGMSLKKRARILDVGCGTGHFLAKCLEKGWTVKGIENNMNARNALPSKISKDVVERVEPLIDQPEKFDVITMWHSLEHLYDLNAAIQDMKKLLNPKGVILVACPNHKSFDASFYKENWAAYDVPRHLWHFDKNAMKDLFSTHNFQLTETLPMHWDSFFVSILSEKTLCNNLFFLRGFFVGLISNVRAVFSGQYSSLIYVLNIKRKTK